MQDSLQQTVKSVIQHSFVEMAMLISALERAKKLLSRMREGVIRTTLGTVDLLPGLDTRTRVAAQPRETFGV
jgi:hypothetical protein